MGTVSGGLPVVASLSRVNPWELLLVNLEHVSASYQVQYETLNCLQP